MEIVKLLLLSIIGFTLGQTFDREDGVCSCDVCCNVLNSTSFTGSDIQQVEFPQVSFDGSYTLVDYGEHDNGFRRMLDSSFRGSRDLEIIQGTPYQHVVRYIKEDGNGKLLYNPLIFAGSGALDCTQSHVYWRVSETEVVAPGVTYSVRSLMQIPLVLSSQGTYCQMNETGGRFEDGSGIGVSLKMLEQPEEVYFAFNNLVDEGSDYYIQFTREPEFLLEPIDSTIQYQYAIRENSVVVTEVEEGGEFFIRVVFVVEDIEQDVEPLAQCLSLDEVVSPTHAYFGAEDGDPRCNITYNNAPSGDENLAGGRTYDLKFPQSQYEDCSEALQVIEDTIQFQTTLRLLTGDIGEECYYFQPGSSQQAININVDADVTDEINEVVAQFSTEITSILPERCTPFDVYPEPQARIRFTINATYAVESGNNVQRVTGSIPYVEDNTMQLVADTSGGAAFECTDTVTSEGLIRECAYYFVTNTCERVYTTQNNECAFEYNSTRYIKDLVFQETYPGGYFVTRRSENLDTGLQATSFELSLCQASGEAPAIDVTDTFNSTIALRNYYDDVPVNWGNTTERNFNDKMIVRLGVGEAAGASFDNVELFIKTVTVTLRNPVENRLLNQFSFNVLEKETQMRNAWTFFYEDPVFCSYYNSQGGPSDAENKCQAFYDPFGDQTTRWNGYNSGGDLPQTLVDHICQRTGVSETALDSRNVLDNRNLDYFMFDPEKWFSDNVNAFMEVTFSVSAVIQVCGDNQTIPTRRALADGSRVLQDELDPSSQVLYVSRDITITVNGENGTTIKIVDGDDGDIWEQHTALLASLIAISSLMFCIICMFGAFRLWRYRSDEYVVTASSGARVHKF